VVVGFWFCLSCFWNVGAVVGSFDCDGDCSDFVCGC